MGLLICPICRSPLARINVAVQCSQGHAFDIAKEGYVNLLVKVRRKSSWPLGDRKDMLQARRDFLEQGLYDELSATVGSLVADFLHQMAHTDGLKQIGVLDSGCGEGHYLARLRVSLHAQFETVDFCYFGIDIAKEAARMAAKRHKGLSFIVSDVKTLIPIRDGSIHVLLNIFAPRNAAEFARIAAPGALLLIVIPGLDHLREACQTLGLLGIEEDKERRTTEQFLGSFDPLKTLRIQKILLLNQEQLSELVRMTPNAWHMHEQTRQALQALKTLETRAEFTVMCFEKKRAA